MSAVCKISRKEGVAGFRLFPGTVCKQAVICRGVFAVIPDIHLHAIDLDGGDMHFDILTGHEKITRLIRYQCDRYFFTEDGGIGAYGFPVETDDGVRFGCAGRIAAEMLLKGSLFQVVQNHFKGDHLRCRGIDVGLFQNRRKRPMVRWLLFVIDNLCRCLAFFAGHSDLKLQLPDLTDFFKGNMHRNRRIQFVKIPEMTLRITRVRGWTSHHDSIFIFIQYGEILGIGLIVAKIPFEFRLSF